MLVFFTAILHCLVCGCLYVEGILELFAGDPDSIRKVPGRRDVNYLDKWTEKDNFQLLSLM